MPKIQTQICQIRQMRQIQKTHAFVPILDPEIKSLVLDLEAGELSDLRIAKLISTLISGLKRRCELPEVQKRYAGYRRGTLAGSGLTSYPVDVDGYAASLDPLEDEEAFWTCWSRHGLVVGREVVSSAQCDASVARIEQILIEMAKGSQAIPTDPDGVPLISRGFLEVYHDDFLAQLRQAVRVYLHHVLIWGRTDLWTSFDRIGLKVPDESGIEALPLHVDQNPLVHPGFQTVQGVLALVDCPAERGTFVAVPGSKAFFQRYAEIVQARSRESGAEYRGEHVELNLGLDFGQKLLQHRQILPLRKGDLLTFDSRTTHANSANLSKETRIVAYLAQGPMPENFVEMSRVRTEAFESALGSNVRDALMHASMRPRYTDSAQANRVRKTERLNRLGRILYGIR